MSFIPADLFVDILSRLPVKSLMRFRCVSKFWNTLINDPDFIKLHLNQFIINGTSNHNHLVFKPDSKLFQLQYPFDFESPNVPKQIDFHHLLPIVSELVATCNGLLCLSTHHNSIIILNPSTRKYKVSVEEPVQYPGCAVSRHPIFGFGYDSVTDEYKVVRIVYFQSGVSLFEDFPDLALRSEVQVYRVSTNSWKKVSSIPCDIRDRSRSSSGVLVNGALHWMGARDTGSSSAISHDLIISFGIRDEEFRELPQPDDFGDVMDKILMIKSGCLCMIRVTRNRGFGYEVWVMKDYGVKESWMKEYVIEETKLIGVVSKYFKPIAFLENGEQILIEGINGKLIVYDLKTTEQIKDFTIVGATDWTEKMTYVQSLVSV